MATQVQIINRGLAFVGMKKITSLTDGSAESDIANQTYTLSLESVLEECMWSFATKRAVLNLTTNTLAYTERSMSQVYTRPADAIKVFQIYPKSALWREEGDYIICDTADIGCLYVYNNTTTASYSPKFAEAVAGKFASDIAYYVLNDPQRGQSMLEHYQSILLPEAMSSNSQIGVGYQTDDHYWVDAKYRNGNKKGQYGI